MGENCNKVMIVEDDLLLLLVEERLVKKLGYTVIGTACEGELAIDKIRRLQPDILMIDINLKGHIDGIDVVQTLKKEGRDLPVIFLSGEEDPDVISKAKQTGCVDYLLKPVTVEKLETTLNKAVAYSQNAAQHAA